MQNKHKINDFIRLSCVKITEIIGLRVWEKMPPLVGATLR